MKESDDFDVVGRPEKLPPSLPWTCDHCDGTHDLLVRFGWPGKELEVCRNCLFGAIDAINLRYSKSELT